MGTRVNSAGRPGLCRKVASRPSIPAGLTTEEKGIFGFNYYWEDPPFRRDEKSGGIWDIGPLPSGKGPGKDLGGHAVLVVGFDDGNQRVLCQNSWGDGKDADGKGGGGCAALLDGLRMDQGLSSDERLLDDQTR